MMFWKRLCLPPTPCYRILSKTAFISTFSYSFCTYISIVFFEMVLAKRTALFANENLLEDFLLSVG